MGEICGAVQGVDDPFVGRLLVRMDAIRGLQKHHRELSLLNAVALAMNATQDLDDILMTALENVLEVLNLTSGGIFLIDHEKSDFSLRVQQGLFERMCTNTYQVRFHDQALMKSLLKKNLALEPKPSFPPFVVSLKAPEPGCSVQLICFLITAKEKASGFPSDPSRCRSWSVRSLFCEKSF